MNFLKIAIHALLVDVFSGLQHLEIDSDRRCEMDERLYVLWKTESAETEAGLEELFSDPGIETHGVCHFLDVRSNLFAQIRDDICITDFQCEE